MVVSLRITLSVIHNRFKDEQGNDDQINCDYKRRCINEIKQVLAGKVVAFLRSVIPRFVVKAHPDVEIITFCDASTTAYSYAVYLRVEVGEEIDANLLFSTSWIAGSRSFSVPRMELLGAELAVMATERMLLHIKNHVNVVRTSYLTDSQVELNNYYHLQDFLMFSQVLGSI